MLALLNCFAALSSVIMFPYPIPPTMWQSFYSSCYIPRGGSAARGKDERTSKSKYQKLLIWDFAMT